MTEVRVIGAAMTPQGRLEAGPAELTRQVVQEVLEDAGIEIDALGLIVAGNSMGGALWDQEMIRGQAWLKDLGLRSTPVINVDNACASAATAMHMGCLAVQGGVSPVLVLGVEKMWHEDRTAAPRALEHALAADERSEQRAALAVETSSVFMGLNAVWAEEMMARGATPKHFAVAASKAYRHGSLNPKAQHRTPMSAEEILAGRAIAGPLTRHMCSSYTDGAAAVVLSASPVSGAPRVLASAMRSGDGSLEYHERLLETAELAWKMSGLGPEDMDVVELHDATSAEELYSLEDLGFFAPGAAGPAIAEGATSIGSDGLVSNPSGGLVARGHPIGATGLCQIVELVTQLRGAAGSRQVAHARVGMGINSGGILGRDTAAVGCHILGI